MWWCLPTGDEYDAVPVDGVGVLGQVLDQEGQVQEEGHREEHQVVHRRELVHLACPTANTVGQA